MKKMSKILSLFLIIGLLGSCSGDDGADGINGADGANGTNGVDGANGADGTSGVDGASGTDGSVDIIYSDWIVSELDGTIANDSDSFLIEAPEITQDILDTGIMLVYGKNVGLISGNIEVYLLPVEVLNEVWSFEIKGAAALGNIEIEVETTDGADIGTPWIDEFRYVIIPSHPPAEAEVGVKTSKDYSKMSYKEMKTLFNIPN